MQAQPTDGVGKKTQSLICRWSSETIKDTYFTADPQNVAEHSAKEWKREWRDEDTIGFNREISSIRDLRDKHVAEAHEWARNVDLSAANVRKACLSPFRPRQRSASTSTHSKTSPHSLTMLWALQVRLSDSVLSNLQCQPSHLCCCWFCWARKTEGAEPSQSYTPRTASPCVWSQNTSVNGMSISLVSGTLHSKVTQHSERMLRRAWESSWLAAKDNIYVIHFFWDMRKFYDSTKAHLLIPQLVARGYPLGILVLGTLTHKSPRCLQVGNSYSDSITGCASSILVGCLQSCSWARGLLFEFVPALGYVVHGSVCEEHIDDLSHFVTNKSRMQLFHDAAKIGKAVKVGTAELGLTLSCKSTLLANDQSLVKLIVSHLGADGTPICLGAAATDLGFETAAEKGRCAASQWKRIWKGKRRAKRVNRLCKMNSEAQKLTMTGIHPVQIYGHTAQGASNAPVNAMSRSLKLDTVLGKTQACLISTVASLFGAKRVPQTAARVEQISEWISMWRNCNVDTRRRIRQVWRKKARMLASNPRSWNQATGPISATICSVLEAGWKPSSPGFGQTPDGSATLDGALFNKAQIIDSFSSDMRCKHGKQRPGILPVLVWRKVSSQISQRKPDLR